MTVCDFRDMEDPILVWERCEWTRQDVSDSIWLTPGKYFILVRLPKISHCKEFWRFCALYEMGKRPLAKYYSDVGLEC